LLLIAFNKPFNVVCQFRAHENDRVLSDFIEVPGVYPAGRLDKDSEGLLLLTNHGGLQHRISQPVHKMPKGYWVQVEGEPDDTAIRSLARGVELKDGMTRPARVKLIDEPTVWERSQPVRYRQSIPTSWLDITIHEGRNRQVRRMTAKVGHPTLRLIRYRIGPWYLNDLQPGEWQERSVPNDIRLQVQSDRQSAR
jgi:23S rRNA pseudouridine2457 synthase